jgi:protein-tyrosine phosphatase
VFGQFRQIDSYYRVHNRLLAGEYPGRWNERRLKATLRQLLDLGATFFLDLTEEQEKRLPAYVRVLQAEAKAVGRAVEHHRMPIPDFETPTADQMRDILDLLDKAIEAGHTVYLHCYAGIGRTGTVVGCHLVRHGRGAQEALDELARLRRGTALADSPSPVTDEQRQLVYEWAALDTASRLEESDVILVRYAGKLSSETVPFVGKTEDDTSRAEKVPTAQRPSPVEKPLRTVEQPEVEKLSRTRGGPRAKKPPPAEESPQVENAPRAKTFETSPIRPRALPKAMKTVIQVAGIAAVATLFAVALAVSMGQIALPILEKKPAIANLDSDNLQGADLAGAELQAADLAGANLRSANLRGANLRGANARGAHLSGAILFEADLHYALLNEADLREADLRGANLQWVDLTDADLSEAQLEGANLRNARLDGVILPDGARWTSTDNMRRFTDPMYQDFWRP